MKKQQQNTMFNAMRAVIDHSEEGDQLFVLISNGKEIVDHTFSFAAKQDLFPALAAYLNSKGILKEFIDFATLGSISLEKQNEETIT